MITSRSERKELFGCDIFTISSPTVSVVKGRSDDRSSFSLRIIRLYDIMISIEYGERVMKMSEWLNEEEQYKDTLNNEEISRIKEVNYCILKVIPYIVCFYCMEVFN